MGKTGGKIPITRTKKRLKIIDPKGKDVSYYKTVGLASQTKK